MTEAIRPENKLVLWARGLAEQSLLDALVVGATAAAERLRGLVVNDNATAESVTDLAKQVKVGQTKLKKDLDTICAMPRAAIEEARGKIQPAIAALAEAEAAGKSAIARWIAERRRREEEEARQQRQANEAAAREAAAKAAEVGEDAPPALVEAAAPVMAPQVRSSVGMAYTTRTLCCEGLDFSAMPDAWKALVEKEAKDDYRLAERREELPDRGAKPHPAGGVEWQGARFWYKESVGIK